MYNFAISIAVFASFQDAVLFGKRSTSQALVIRRHCNAKFQMRELGFTSVLKDFIMSLGRPGVVWWGARHRLSQRSLAALIGIGIKHFSRAHYLTILRTPIEFVHEH